jgi:hypothetical protein
MTTTTCFARIFMLAALCGATAAGTAAASPTRADVRAELDAARASGELYAFTGEDSGSFWLARQVRPSTLTRQAVRAEVLAARALGLLDLMTGEDSGSVHLARESRQPGLIYAGPNQGAQRHAAADTSVDPS